MHGKSRQNKRIQLDQHIWRGSMPDVLACWNLQEDKHVTTSHYLRRSCPNIPLWDPWGKFQQVFVFIYGFLHSPHTHHTFQKFIRPNSSHSRTIVGSLGQVSTSTPFTLNTRWSPPIQHIYLQQTAQTARKKCIPATFSSFEYVLCLTLSVGLSLKLGKASKKTFL